MKNKVIEIGYARAMGAFCKTDFQSDLDVCAYHEFAGTANDRKYFIDLDMGKIFVRYYKDGIYVDSQYFQSTKAKYKALASVYEERIYGN